MATIPTPLFFRSDKDPQIMTSNEINFNINQVISAYAQNPLMTLEPSTVDSGNLGPIADTRRTTSATNSTTFNVPASASATLVITGANFYLKQTIADSADAQQPVNPLPLYRNPDGSLQSMTPTEFTDTFIVPAIERFLLDSNEDTSFQGGTHILSTSQSVVDHVLVSPTPAFSDTRSADGGSSSYPNAGIGNVGTTRDNPVTHTNFYIHRKKGPNGDADSAEQPFGMYRRTDGDIQAYSLTEWNSLLQGYMRWKLHSSYGGGFEYSLSTGSIRGTGITDTRLDTSAETTGNRLVTSDDYRNQRYPGGVPQNITTTYLRMKKRGT